MSEIKLKDIKKAEVRNEYSHTDDKGLNFIKKLVVTMKNGVEIRMPVEVWVPNGVS